MISHTSKISHTCKISLTHVRSSAYQFPSYPARYTLHFMFACGAFVAPLVARPFLRDEVEVAVEGSWELWEIRSLYPMVGLISLAVTPGYLICWMLERPKDKSKDMLVEKQDGTRVGLGCRRPVTLNQPLNKKKNISSQVVACWTYGCLLLCLHRG